MIQTFYTGLPDQPIATNLTRYANPFGTWVSSTPEWNATQTDSDVVVPVDCVFKNLKVEATQVSDVDCTFTLLKQDGPTDMEVVLEAGETIVESTTANNVSLSAGDVVVLKAVTPAGGSTDLKVIWSFECETETNFQCFTVSDRFTPNTGLDTEHNIYTGQNGTISRHTAIIPHDCTLTGYVADTATTPGAGKTWDFNVYKNGTIVSGTTATISNGETQATKIGLSIDLTAGDDVYITSEPTGTPSATKHSFGAIFNSDTAGEALQGGTQDNNPAQGATEYNQPFQSGFAWVVDESTRIAYSASHAVTIKNLNVQVSTAPGGGKSWVLTLRKNGVDTALTVTISGTDTTGSDTTNEISVFEGDELSLSLVPSGTPANTFFTYGFTTKSLGLQASTDGRYRAQDKREWLEMRVPGSTNRTEVHDLERAYYARILGSDAVGTLAELRRLWIKKVIDLNGGTVPSTNYEPDLWKHMMAVLALPITNNHEENLRVFYRTATIN